ncbi:MAG: TraB/GumN family protein [Allosphingosinicella sp.]
MKKLLLAAAVTLGSSIVAITGPAAAMQSSTAVTQGPAAALPDADPAMWVVRDHDTTIYLFGTFHMLDGRPWFNDEVKTAFDSSGELVMEALMPQNPAELQPLIMRYAVDPNGRRLSDRLTAEQNAALGQTLASMGAPATAFDQFEPWFVSMSMVSIAAQRLGASPENGPEAVLARAARQRSLPMAELEGFEWQLRLFDGMSEEQQMAQLRQTIDQLDEMEEGLAPLLAAWSTGDVEKLVELMEQDEVQDRDLHDMLFLNRNRSWAEWLDNRLDQPGTVFVAVGAGHLAGPDSVQRLLAARGIVARRVAHEGDIHPAS